MMNRQTESTRINAIRERLLDKYSCGLLGVMAVRSRVPEYQLREWCEDASKIPSASELVDIQHAVSDATTMEGDSHDGL